MVTDILAAIVPKDRWCRRALVVAVAAVLLGLLLVVTGLRFPGAAAIAVGCALLGLGAPAVAVWLMVILLPVHPFAMRVATVDLGFGGRELLLLSAWKEIVLGAILLSVGISLARRGLPPRPRELISRLTATDALAAALVVLVALWLVAAPSLAAVNQVRLLLFPIAVYVVLRTGIVPTRGLPLTAAVAVTVIGVFGFLQSTFFGWDWVIKYYGTPGLPVPSTFAATGVEGPRAAGTLASPNEFAFVVGTGLIMALVLAGRGRGRATLGFTLLVAGLAAGLVLSFSRSTLIGVGLAVVTLGVAAVILGSWGRRTVLRVVAVAAPSLALALVLFVSRGGLDLAASTIVTAPGPAPAPAPGATPVASGPPASPTATTVGDPSAAGHVASIRRAVDAIVDHPLGLGLGVVGARTGPGDAAAEPLIVESWFLSLGLTFGWLGLLWASLVPFAFWRSGLRATRLLPAIGLMTVGSATMVAVNGFVLPTMLEPQVALLPWVLVAVAEGALASGSDETAQPRAGGATAQGVIAAGELPPRPLGRPPRWPRPSGPR